MHSLSLSVCLLLLALLPSLFVQYRVFVPLLPAREVRRLGGAFVSFYVVFAFVVLLVFSQGIVGVSWISFKDVFALHALPCLLLGLLFVPSYRLQYIFVLGMQGLFIVALLTLILNVELFFVSPGIFFQYINAYLIAYAVSYIVLAPVLLKFFCTVITANHGVDLLAFWKYAAWIPVLLLLYAAILAHTNEPVAREYLVPRLLQALFGVCIAITMYLGTRKMNEAMELKRENAALLTQMEMFAHYARLLQSSQKLLSIYRHDTRHQLRLLSSLIQEKNDRDSLALLETLTQELAHVQPFRWGKNASMRKSLLPLIEAARADGIHVMADLSLAAQFPFEEELAKAAARLVKAALTVSRGQAEAKRSVVVIARQTDSSIMLLIGNRQSEPVAMDGEGHPCAGPYAEALPLVQQFVARHEGAAGRCTYKEGWTIVNLRIPCSRGDAL